MSEPISEEEPENDVMRFRRVMFDTLQEQIKLLEHNEHSVLTGFCVLVEIMAPGNVAGPSRALYGFCSDATGIGDSAPWQTQGWLFNALMNYEDMFMEEPDEEDDDGD